MKFSEKLQFLRKENKMSQEELADLLEVSRQAVSKWESGTTYPEMDKLLSLCKIFKCTLDDLTNDEIKPDDFNKDKVNNDNVIYSGLNLINKSIDMFNSMSGKERLKLLVEVFFLIVMVLMFHIPFDILNKLGYKIFVNFNNQLCSLLSSVWFSLLEICYIIFAVFVFAYIFKIRFLDNYEKTDKSKIKEKKKEEKEVKGKKEIINEAQQVIIENKKSSLESIFLFLGKVFLFFLKAIATCIFFALVFLLVFDFAAFGIACYLLFRGLFYLGVFMTLLSFAALNIIVLEVIVKFIFNNHVDLKRIFLIFILSLSLLGIGIGVTSLEIASLKFIDEVPKEYTKVTDERIFNMTDNTMVFNRYEFNSENIEYRIDNSLDKEIKVEIEHYSDFTSVGNYVYGDKIIIIDDYIQNPKIINNIIEDLKNHKIHNYDKLNSTNITVVTSAQNIEKMKQNIKKSLAELESEELERESYQNTISDLYSKIDELEAELQKVNDEKADLEAEKEELNENLEEYKQRIKELLNE